MLETIHTVFGFTSLAFGVVVLLRPKGTSFHIWTGRLYAVSMICLCATSFGMFELFGGFGVFHVAAILSLVTTISGVSAALLRRKLKGWIYWHYQFMAWSYLGLLGATSNEAFVHIGPLTAAAQEYRFLPLLALAVIFFGGGFYVNKVMQRTVRKVGAHAGAG